MEKTDMEQILKKVNASYKVSFVLKLFCHLGVVISVAVFGHLFLFFIELSIIKFVGFLITLGVPFLLISYLRTLINAPRPYEIYSFYSDPPKKGSGSSFPSRHAFSIFAIGTFCMFVYPFIGLTTLSFGVIMCVCRVLLGMHFVRDVIAGAITGIVTSLIGAFILLI